MVIEIRAIKEMPLLNLILSLRKKILKKGADVNDNINPFIEHIILFLDWRAIGCARISPCMEKNSIRIENIAVLKEYRKWGFHDILLKFLIDRCIEHWERTDIYLYAKTTEEMWYIKADFDTIGTPFIEGGIEYIEMKFNSDPHSTLVKAGLSLP